MRSEYPALPLPREGKQAIIPALVCAGICVALMRAGFFSFFFLVPLGICVIFFGPYAAWLGSVCASVANGVWSAGFFLRYGGLNNSGIDALYFAVFALGFTWLMAGPPVPAIPPMRTIFRFMAASAAGALVFLAMIFSLGNDESFSMLLRSRIEAISSSFIGASGSDAAQMAYMERLLTPDAIIKIFSMIILRGGALVSAVFLLFFSRQTVFVLARLFRRQAGNVGTDLAGFYVPRTTIWVLSLSLPVVLLCRIASLEIIEIAAWNLLVMCAIMFLAQGCGIVLFAFTRKPMPAIMRLVLGMLMIFIIFSPGVNVVAMGILIVMGIAENWIPLRKMVNKSIDNNE